METTLGDVLQALRDGNEKMEQIVHAMARIKELQEINGMRLDVLQNRIISHEAFIDEREGRFAERFREDIETESSV